MNIDKHLEYLICVFQILLENQFYLNESKCSFGQDTVEYLGHIVSKHGVQPENGKVAVVQKWPLPSSIKDLRAFLGLRVITEGL